MSRAETANTRVRELHPGWYASVMGTAILAVSAYDNPGNLSATLGTAHVIGVVLAVVAYAIALVLTVAYTIRWIGHRDAALADLRHPVLGAMHATLPAGLLVLAVMTSVVGPGLFPETAVTAMIATLAVSGTVLAIVFSVAFSYTLFAGEPPVTMVNGGWFIPPVATIIIPVALMPLMPHVSGGNAALLLALSYAAYGIGFLLFVFMMALLHARLVVHPLPPAALVPTFWVALGPVGVGALAPLAMSRAGQSLFGDAAGAIDMASRIFASALWGFGLWWLAIAIAITVRYLRSGAIPFHLGWWAFTFPLGAFTVATLKLARAWDTAALEVGGVILFVTLASFWALVASRTVGALRTGKVWQR